MKDPADHRTPRAPRRTSFAGAAADPAVLTSEGIRAGTKSRLRQIHVATDPKHCSACEEDLGTPALDYRLVLRCTTARREA